MTCNNLGAVWICKRCWGIVRPPADEVSTKLMNTCTGHTSNGSKKFGLLLPKECPVAFSVPQQLKPVQVQHAVQHHTQQSKLRLFFGNSVRKPREEVVSPSADNSRASSSTLTAQSCPLGRAQLRARAEFDQEEVPSPPNKHQDGEAVQGGPVKVGTKAKAAKEKAHPKHRQNASLEEAFKELATWRYAQGLRRISRSTLAKSKKRPGARKRKELWLQKQKEKEEKDGSKSSTRPSVPTSGSKTIKAMLRREEGGDKVL